MIKFFRSIRKTLLNEGKTSKYFKYAIGEILLVVIGILIALQINNWNEKRKQTELGYQYLTEMRYELQDDVAMLDYYINTLKRSIENHEAALKTKNINTLPLDSLYMLVTAQNLDFKVSELTYNKMNNLGITKLSDNNKLNTMIKFLASWRTKCCYGRGNSSLHTGNVIRRWITRDGWQRNRKNLTWCTMMAKPEVPREGMKKPTHMEQSQTEL